MPSVMVDLGSVNATFTSGGADYLITGNLKHFPRFWKNTKIINSREFISLVAPHLLS